MFLFYCSKYTQLRFSVRTLCCFYSVHMKSFDMTFQDQNTIQETNRISECSEMKLKEQLTYDHDSTKLCA